MKETTKTSRAAGQLEKMFRQLNQDSFGGELEEPIITIQSTPRAYGHVTVCKTWKRKDDWRHVCPKCKAIARTTKKFPLICGICKVEMEIED